MGIQFSVYLNTSGKIFLINNLNINILYVLLMLGNTCTIKWYQNLHYIFHSALKTSFKISYNQISFLNVYKCLKYM